MAFIKNEKNYWLMSHVVPVIVFLHLIWGGYVDVIGAGGACTGWPLCNGEIIPDISDPLVLAKFFHRILSILVLIAVALLFAFSYGQREKSARLFRSIALMTVLVVIEILLGAVTVVMTLDALWVIAHLTTGLLVYSFSIIALAWARADLTVK